VFEEYRYDALGRRVLVRSRRKCQNINDDIGGSECQVGMVRRTVWDGTQEFYEIQMPDSTTLPGWFENDTSFVPAPVITSPGRWDTNPFFGRVAYTYGLAIDKPISVVRVGYTDLSAFFGNGAQPRRELPPFAFYPSWTVRGQADRFFYSDGDTEKCETISGELRCVRGYLPAGWFAYKRTLITPGGWQGTLLEDKRDHAGTYYRRARVYDPTSGRFTQEDPIGLGGGINLYGFASGDPVNFGDPFGLYTQIQCRPIRSVGGLAVHCGLRVVNERLGVNQVYELTRVGDRNTFYNQKDAGTFTEGGWMTLTPPDGMTEDEYDRAILGAYRSVSQRITTTRPRYSSGNCKNSNRFVRDVVKAAGGTIPEGVDHRRPSWVFGAPGLRYGDCEYDKNPTYPRPLIW
jgi:RHS repeat-associated protein